MKEKNNSVVKQASTVLNNLGIWAILVLLFVFLSITTGNSFLTSSNLINLVRQICVTGVCAIGAALECDKGTVPLSHSRKACLAQGFVEDDGGAVGEGECADAVVIRVDEVTADILLKDGFVAVLGMPQRFLVGFPGLGVIE